MCFWFGTFLPLNFSAKNFFTYIFIFPCAYRKNAFFFPFFSRHIAPRKVFFFFCFFYFSPRRFSTFFVFLNLYVAARRNFGFFCSIQNCFEIFIFFNFLPTFAHFNAQIHFLRFFCLYRSTFN